MWSPIGVSWLTGLQGARLHLGLWAPLHLFWHLKKETTEKVIYVLTALFLKKDASFPLTFFSRGSGHMAPPSCKQPKESMNLYWSIWHVCHIALLFSSTNHRSISEPLLVERFTPKFIEIEIIWSTNICNSLEHIFLEVDFKLNLNTRDLLTTSVR